MSCCGGGTVRLLPLTSHAVDSPCHWPALTNSSLCLPSNSCSTVCTAPRQYICLCQHCKFCSAISSFCLARCVSMPPDGRQWRYVFDLSIHLCVRIGVCAYRHAGRGIQQSACHRVLWLFALGLVRYHKTLTSYFAGQMPFWSSDQQCFSDSLFVAYFSGVWPCPQSNASVLKRLPSSMRMMDQCLRSDVVALSHVWLGLPGGRFLSDGGLWISVKMLKRNIDWLWEIVSVTDWWSVTYFAVTAAAVAIWSLFW